MYELLSFILENCLVVVIEPLDAIIKQQLDKLGDKASVVTRGQKTEHTNFLFGHPEDVLQNRDFFDMFQETTCILKKCF